jgi:hypothetical protein
MASSSETVNIAENGGSTYENILKSYMEDSYGASYKIPTEQLSDFVEWNLSTQNTFIGWITISVPCQELHSQWPLLKICPLSHMLKKCF